MEYNLQLNAQNGSGFDTWIVLNNLSCDKRIVNSIKKYSLDILRKTKKQFPENLHFRCGMTHLDYSLKKLSKTFKLQKELLKTELNHDEIDYNNYKDKINEWLPYVKNDVLCTAFRYAR